METDSTGAAAKAAPNSSEQTNSPMQESASTPSDMDTTLISSNTPSAVSTSKSTGGISSISISDTTPSTSDKKTPSRKRASTGGLKVKASSISSKIPAFLFKSSKGNVTYFTLVHEAIVVLADRTGSSVIAIQKFMKATHPEVLSIKPKAFNTAVYNAIKAGVKDEKFVKVKCSYKVNTKWVQKEKSSFRAKEAQKKAMEKKRKKNAEEGKKKKEAAEKAAKLKQQKLEAEQKKKAESIITQDQKEKMKEMKLAKEALERKKEAMAKKAKELQDKIKKRRFPMEDLELIAEDKALGVKRPADVTRPTFLPYALQSLLAHDIRPTNKKATPAAVLNACTSTLSNGSRGMMSDTLQVYHFFVGDVGYARMFENSVPNFTLKQLLHAVNEVVIGNTKKSRVVPPLISHLFVTALSVLLSPTAEDWVSDESADHSAWDNLKADFVKLKSCLSAESWGEILASYVSAMESFYSSESSSDPDALSGFPISMDYLHSDDEDEDVIINQCDEDAQESSGSGVYVGHDDSPMAKGYNKLLRQDPWFLSADELISLLRALTDDILAMKPALAKEMSDRDEKLFELLKTKKATESQFRKMRLGYEGPKRIKTRKVVDDKENNGNSENKDIQEKVVFKPTATKQQFEDATKDRDKAVEQYDKGLRNLVHRGQPIGYDKNHSAIYYFHHDPDSLYIEKTQNEAFDDVRTWHCVDSKPLFESFSSSLDIRGIREHSLYNTLIGNGGSSSLKRNLYDSNRKTSLIAAYQRQQSDLTRRLDNAMIARSESSRRSGRLKTTAKDEVSLIEEELEQVRIEHEAQLSALETIHDYSILTGIQLLSEFEVYYGLSSRCSQLWNDDESKQGIVGKIAKDLLDLEKVCNDLAPWDRDDISRNEWRSNIEDTTTAWKMGCTFYIGHKAKEPQDPSPTKRQRMSIDSSATPKSPSVSFEDVLATFKGPLIDLENRFYAITGIERATKEVDEASDNISVVSNESDDCKAEAERTERANYAWKKKIYKLHLIPARRASAVRDTIISAIAIARKGNINDALEDLRGALKLHRPGAGGRARTMALSLLEKYGFKPGEEDDDMDEIEDASSETASIQETNDNENDLQSSSFLPPNAMMLGGSLEGDNNADRVDWKHAVNTCKSISRFAAIVAALKSRTTPRTEKITKDKKALSKAIAYWETSGKTRKKTKKPASSSKKYGSGTEIWADVEPSDEFIMCKVEGFPWWPACVCVAKDDDIAKSMKSLNRILVSFVGEQHLYVVEKDSEVKPFDATFTEDDSSSYSPEAVKNVKNGIIMAKRILRARGLSMGELKGVNIIDTTCVEEKKTSC